MVNFVTEARKLWKCGSVEDPQQYINNFRNGFICPQYCGSKEVRIEIAYAHLFEKELGKLKWNVC
jgi:hypothetical protein